MSDAISSFHTHTELCKHALGEPRDYVAQAALEGCTALGFSDHTPFPDDGTDWWPEVRMHSSEAAGYVQAVREAAQDAPFPVYCGFECEYDPRYNSWYRDYLRAELDTDYLVLGMHWVVDGDRRIYIPEVAGDTRLLHRYADQTVAALQSGLFAFLAHPDVLMARSRTTWNTDIAACLTAILDCAVSLDIPVEVNGNGLSRGLMLDKGQVMRYQYPVEPFWLLAKEKGARVLCNSDAHTPQDVLSFARRSREFAANLGITPLDTIF